LKRSLRSSSWAVGIVAALGGLSAISKAEGDGRDRERLERLALQKFDELLATGDTTNAESGDFTDRNQPDLSWESQVTPSGVDTVNHISVTVKRKNDTSIAQSPRLTACFIVSAHNDHHGGHSVMKRTGLTIMELLVATAMSVIVIGAAGQAYISGMRTSETIQRTRSLRKPAFSSKIVSPG